MTSEHLYFITFCVGNLSEALHKSASEVYGILRSSGVLNDYIIPCYDVLHTFSKEYIVEDFKEVLKERGALSWEEDALSFFYNSTTYELISEGVADLHCRSDEYLAEELMLEYKEKENDYLS